MYHRMYFILLVCPFLADGFSDLIFSTKSGSNPYTYTYSLLFGEESSHFPSSFSILSENVSKATLSHTDFANLDYSVMGGGDFNRDGYDDIYLSSVEFVAPGGEYLVPGFEATLEGDAFMANVGGFYVTSSFSSISMAGDWNGE
jgi:hypothetical protein